MFSPTTLQTPTIAPQEESIKEEKSVKEDSEKLFRELDAYDWASDLEFQTGLRTILGSGQGADVDVEREEWLTLQAKCFYFSRKTKTPISIPSYQQWKAQQLQPPPPHHPPYSTSSPPQTPSQQPPSQQPPPTYPPTFHELISLINSGQTIPGIRDVPNTVLAGQNSEPTRVERRKPWEKCVGVGGEEGEEKSKGE